ncbi:MAG TPA: pitrilysin family protein [Gammaproteobacteria bacterium]
MNKQVMGRMGLWTRNKLNIALLLQLVLMPACFGQSESALNAPAEVHEYTLRNGMKVLVQPDTRSPVVVSQVWYKVGSSYEYSGITGLSHMLEHMMFKGTDDLKPGEFSEIIALNGGSENAATSKDYTWYFQSIANDRLELCLKLEAERMSDVIFDEKEFLKERDVVAEERRRRYEDDPQSLTYEQFMATAFVNSPYHHLPIGWMQDIQAYTVEDAKRWYKNWYAPNNATLVVVGDVEPDEVYRLAKKYFGPLKPSDIPRLKPRDEIPQLGLRRIKVQDARARVPYLLMGYKAPVLNTVKDPAEIYALEVLAGILDGGESARLSRNIVRGRQLAVSAGISYNPYSRLDELFTFVATPVGTVSVEKLEEALMKEIETLKNQKVSEAELARVKAQVVAADVYQRDSMYYQAMRLGVLETVGLGWRRLEEYIPGVQAVTAEQVQAVARKYLIDRHLTVAELVPQATTDEGA